MSEMNRVQRWRQQQRAAGKDALTIWLPRELKLSLEDMALKRHCSPSDLIQQALTTCYPLTADVTDMVTDTSVTDTSQIRLMLQQELRACFGDRQLPLRLDPAHHVTVTVADTYGQADGRSAALEVTHVTDTVTDTVTDAVPDTVADPHGQTEDGSATTHKAHSVPDTVTDTSTGPAPNVNDTVTDTDDVPDTVTGTGSVPTAKRKAPSRQRAATDTVSATDAPQRSARRRKRQAASAD